MSNKTILLFCFFAILTNFCTAQVDVPTHRYDKTRIGWNAQETKLNTSNVTNSQFALLFKRQVDDQIYAQPLVIANLTINNRKQNVVYVATVNNTIYAFNADDSTTTAPIWYASFTPIGSRVINVNDMFAGYRDFTKNMGIVGTPVIDRAKFAMYFVSRHYNLNDNKFYQILHAIDIRTGLEMANSPTQISATYKGTGDGNVNGIITFDTKKQNQRSALLLHDGVIYVCWASHGDWGPYHGWVIGFDANTLQKKYVYNANPNGYDAGIWMSGGGPCVDAAGNIYLTTGNGSVGQNGNPNDPINRGESLLKLTATDSLRLTDFFTPSNYAFLEQYDLDYGVDAPMLIPNTNLNLSGSKEGKLYMTDNNNMGKCTPNDDFVRQILYANNQNVPEKHIHGTPVYLKYNSSQDNECVYVWAESDSITQFFFDRNTQRFDLTRTKKGNLKLDFGMPGSSLTASSNGTTDGTSIVWASHPTFGDANLVLRPGSLDAYDARDVKTLLWTSRTFPNRDSVGWFAKFNPPVVANGKVYLASFSNRLNVYGIIGSAVNAVADIEPAALNNISIFPNPVKQTLHLQYDVQDNISELTVNVADLTGRIIWSQKISADFGKHDEQIELPASVPKGFYEVLFYADQKLVGAEKFIKL